MAKIVIKNFLTIKDAEIDIHPVTVFIGPQASGKSTAAKLIYFFKSIPDIALETVCTQALQRQAMPKKIQEEALSLFTKIFGNYRNPGASVQYFPNADHNDPISITCDEKKQLHLQLPQAILSFIIESSNAKNHRIASALFSTEKTSEKTPSFDASIQFYAHLRELLLNNIPSWRPPHYIPAGRSYFAVIDRNPYLFLNNGTKLDYFLTELGRLYRTSLDQPPIDFNDSNSASQEVFLLPFPPEITDGQFIYDTKANTSYIQHHDNSYTDIQYASSGEQEFLPLLVILRSQLSHAQKSDFTIEEPEAHLYPKAQYAVVRNLMRFRNHFTKSTSTKEERTHWQGNMLITTHSPYVLTALNNLLLAGRKAADATDDNALAKLRNIVPEECWIAPGDLACYQISDGTASNILDAGLINAESIDDASLLISDDFDSILAL